MVPTCHSGQTYSTVATTKAKETPTSAIANATPIATPTIIVTHVTTATSIGTHVIAHMTFALAAFTTTTTSTMSTFAPITTTLFRKGKYV